jgi:long-chain acyl-CoA synthetase
MLKPGAQVTVSELLAHTGTRIARFKIPSHIWLQDEQLPRIASAKIDKRTLKREAIDRLAKESDRVG